MDPLNDGVNGGEIINVVEFDTFLLLECERNENKEKESRIGPLIERLVYGSVNLAQLLDWLLPKPKNCDYKPQTVNWFSSNIFVLLKFKTKRQ